MHAGTHARMHGRTHIHILYVCNLPNYIQLLLIIGLILAVNWLNAVKVD